MSKPLSNTTLIIVLILVIFAVIGLGYLTYRSINETASEPSPTSTLATKSPSATPTKSATPTAATSASSEKMTIKIFMIAEGDNGASGKMIGCGDSAVAVNHEVPKTDAVLKAAIEQLLSIKDKSYGGSGLVNSLYQSNLQLQSVSISNGKATIKLTGTIMSQGSCDDPRLKAQLEETALQFSTVKEVEILVNDKDINDIFSQKG